MWVDNLMSSGSLEQPGLKMEEEEEEQQHWRCEIESSNTRHLK